MKFALIAATMMSTLGTAALAQGASPDGSEPAISFEPYVGVLGGYHDFDRRSTFGQGSPEGALIEGVAGVNIPLGPVFIGVEGNVAKGFSDLDWEYGVRGRAGLRAGQSGMIYASFGHQWVNGDRGFSDQHSWIYGVGVEFGPKEIGLGGILGEAGPRIRLQVETYEFDSVRPMAGLIFAF